MSNCTSWGSVGDISQLTKNIFLFHNFRSNLNTGFFKNSVFLSRKLYFIGLRSRVIASPTMDPLAEYTVRTEVISDSTAQVVPPHQGQPSCYLFFKVRLATRGHERHTGQFLMIFFLWFITRAGVKPGLLGWKSSFLPLYHPDYLSRGGWSEAEALSRTRQTLAACANRCCSVGSMCSREE